MRQDRASSEAAIALVAARQHGVVSLGQLREAGLTHEAISRRVRAYRFHRVFRGVYAVGHAGLSNEGRWMAAVLACAEGAVLSHRNAAELWRLLEPGSGPSHVTVRGDAGRSRRRGIRVHRSSSLTRAMTTRHRGIAVTAPARTIADLHRVESPRLVRHAIRQAEFHELDLGDLPTDRTRSELESMFLALCRRHRLAPPEVNARLGEFTVDFLWRDRRLIVETDGWGGHGGRQAFEDDRARDARLKLLGYDVVRFTYRQVDTEPTRVAKTLASLLAR